MVSRKSKSVGPTTPRRRGPDVQYQVCRGVLARCKKCFSTERGRIVSSRRTPYNRMIDGLPCSHLLTQVTRCKCGEPMKMLFHENIIHEEPRLYGQRKS